MEILGIAFVKGDDAGRKWLQTYAKTHDLTWTLVPTDEAWYAPPFEAYNVHFLPFALLIDREGHLISAGVRAEKIEPEIARALGETKASTR